MNLHPNVLKWVEALESGEYEQTNSILHSRTERGGDRYCCLGVACALAVEDGVKLEVERQPFSSTSALIQFRYGGLQATLPRAVAKWLGLRLDGDIQIGRHTAIEMNDELGMSFSEIAASIREFGIADIKPPPPSETDSE